MYLPTVYLINSSFRSRFFPNEVMRVPLYEAVPIELVMSQCWVMDLNTYCKVRETFTCILCIRGEAPRLLKP